MPNFIRPFLSSLFATISIYIPRISKLENILRPAISALILLVATMISLLIASQDPFSLPIAGLLFVISTIMIAINGEIRSELQQVARRDEQLRTILQSQQMLVNSTDVSESSPNAETRLLGFSSEEEASFAQTAMPIFRDPFLYFCFGYFYGHNGFKLFWQSLMANPILMSHSITTTAYTLFL